MSAYWDRLEGLELTVEQYALERLELDVSSGFFRVSTVILLQGDGTDGVGEDVTYETPDHDRLQQAGPILPLTGSWTLGSFCEHVERLDLWPAPPEREASRHYRIWAYESAALDLALRQAGVSLHGRLAITPRPVHFVVSLRLGEPPTMAPLRSRLERYPALQFKLDPTNDWTPELAAEVAALGAVESLDLKGQYKGSIVDVEPDPALYEMLLAAFPDVWLEDPHTGVAEIDALVEPVRDRVTWDAVIHGVEDIVGLPYEPKMVNVKPSRLGGLRSVLAAYDYCVEQGIGMYGGGQFELGPGRGQIQYLASLLHPDGPNDVAPGGYNAPEPAAGLPDSPLAVAVEPTGFRWSA
jgi:L-alanine-DL-glutamate epimerase-like enolase superfamily enzyme